MSISLKDYPLTPPNPTVDDKGQWHSFNDEPASIEFDNDGKDFSVTGKLAVRYENHFYCKHGAKHRDNDKPAVIQHVRYDDDKADVFHEAWYQNGERHRIGEPAEKHYIPHWQNALELVIYCQNGKLHNLYGPAVVGYNDGSFDFCDYYLNGIHCEGKDEQEPEEQYNEVIKALKAANEFGDPLSILAQTTIKLMLEGN